MKLSTLGKGIALLVVLAICGLLAIAALPWVASTQIVRDRIAHELSVWSGYRVQLSGAPSLEVWPSFRATLDDVSLHEWAGSDRPPVLHADRVDIDLSALAALRGEIVFSGLKLTRPLLRLSHPGPVVDLPASPGGGRMMHAVNLARALVSQRPNDPDLNSLPNDPFGTVEFTEGRISVMDANGDEDIVTSLSGRIAWPALNRPVNLSATGIWRGENFTVEGSSQNPLVLIAGGNAPTGFSLRSPLLNGNFNGVANLSANSFFEGTGSLSSPSLRRMLEWSRTDIAPGAAIGSISIAGRLTGNASRFKIENAELNIGGNVGKGVLDVGFGAGVPSIAGTLDFAQLDIGSFLTAFSPLASGRGTIYEPIDTSFAEQIALDLRLSAAQALLGDTTYSAMAATAQVKGGLSAFDISDATVLGGTLQAGLRIDRSDEEANLVEVRLMANGIDAGALADKWGMAMLRPQARADVSVTIKGSGRDWHAAMGNAQGTASLSLGAGSISGFNYQGFMDRWNGGEFFALSEVADGSVTIRGAQFRANVDRGVARIDTADILLENNIISIDGIVPYFGRALALSGMLQPDEGNGQRGAPFATFFIGGAWDAPFVAPIQRSQGAQ